MSSAGRWGAVARRVRVPLGFAFAALYIWLARPTWVTLAIGAVIIAAGLALRAVAAGHLRKEVELATGGPYRYTRNPLYLGSLIIAMGFVVGARNLWIALLAAAYFAIIYWPVIAGEEQRLRERFPEYDDYAQRVPRLLPWFTSAPPSSVRFSPALYRRNREYNALIGAALMLAALAARIHWSPQ